MSTKPRYSYAPLLSPRHTRLVILHSSKADDDPITCELVQVNIDDGPIYEALSYTWDNEVPWTPLEIASANGSGPRSLRITTNCHRALTILSKRIGRKPTAKIGLWVDAICINQHCNDERSAQVSMMAEIYRNARHVVVWLGNPHAPPNRISLLPLQLSRPFSQYQQEIRSRKRKLRWINKICSAAGPPVWKMIAKGSAGSLQLFSAPYWTRAWTLQEYPHVTTRILCLNSKYSSVLGIRHVAAVLAVGPLHHQLFERNRRQELLTSQARLLSTFLYAVIDLQCSDPRDKIFALRESFPSVFGGISVDYNRTVEDVFTEATRCLILASQDLETLYTSCSCRKPYLSPQQESYNISSWVIDWTGASEGGLYSFTGGNLRDETSWHLTRILSEHPQLGGDLPASFSDDGARLKLRGKSLRQVSKCVSDRIAYYQNSKAGAKALVRAVRKFLSEATGKRYTSEAPLGCVMVKLLRLMYESESDEIKKAESQMEVESDVDRICDLMKEGAGAYSLYMRRKRLFVATDGKIGAGNRDLVPGDLICDFAGLSMPFIVRKRGTYHELISPAVVIGAMHTETWPEDENEIVPWEIV